MLANGAFYAGLPPGPLTASINPRRVPTDLGIGPAIAVASTTAAAGPTLLAPPKPKDAVTVRFMDELKPLYSRDDKDGRPPPQSARAKARARAAAKAAADKK